MATELLERLQEEGADEERLEPSGLGLLHLLLHREEPLRVHRLLRERVAVEERLRRWSWSSALVDLLVRRAHLGLVAVADRLDEQVLEAGLLEDLAEDVEDAALQGLALDASFSSRRW
jgi:hypothetical protein